MTVKHRQRRPSTPSTPSMISESRGMTSGGIIACMAILLLSVSSFGIAGVQSARSASLHESDYRMWKAFLEAAKESPELRIELDQNIRDAVITVGARGGAPDDIKSELRAKISGLDNVGIERSDRGTVFVTVAKIISVGRAAATATASTKIGIRFYDARDFAFLLRDNVRSSENLNASYYDQGSGFNVSLSSRVEGGRTVTRIEVKEASTGFSYVLDVSR